MPAAPRVVIVTGATGGLGRAFAAAFAVRGDRLVVTDLDQDACAALAAECGNDSAGIACDLADPRAIDRFWARIDAEVGRPDVLLNNAGVGPSMQPTLDTDPDDFARVIAVNLVAPARMLDEAAARMAPGSAIVSTASLAGLVPNPRRNAYGAAKAALVALTRRAALAHGPQGIAVSAIAPGYVLTDMVATLARNGSIDLGAVRRRVPLGRLARPDEMASVVAFLASPDGAVCAGQTLPVDGGWSTFNMGGDACANALPAPPAEARAVPAPPGRLILLAEDGSWADRIVSASVDAVRVAPGRTPAETAARLSAVTDVAAIVVLGASGADDAALYRRDFAALREAVRRLYGQPGAVVYLAPPEAPGLRDGGIAMLLRGMAAEFGPVGLRINAIVQWSAVAAAPDMAARLARFLAGPDASYVTGAVLATALPDWTKNAPDLQKAG